MAVSKGLKYNQYLLTDDAGNPVIPYIPIATYEHVGIAKPDNSTVTIQSDGTIVANVGYYDTIGSSSTPIYLQNGQFEECNTSYIAHKGSNSVGDVDTPVYIRSDGQLATCDISGYADKDLSNIPTSAKLTMGRQLRGTNYESTQPIVDPPLQRFWLDSDTSAKTTYSFNPLSTTECAKFGIYKNAEYWLATVAVRCYSTSQDVTRSIQVWSDLLPPEARVASGSTGTPTSGLAFGVVSNYGRHSMNITEIPISKSYPNVYFYKSSNMQLLNPGGEWLYAGSMLEVVRIRPII